MSSTRNSEKIGVPLSSLVDAINRPFDYHNNARVPSGDPMPTVSMVDFDDVNGWDTPTTQSDAATYTLEGIGCIYLYGPSQIRNASFNVTTGQQSNQVLYGPVYFFIDTSGHIKTLDVVDESGGSTEYATAWFARTTANYLTIFGSDLSYDATEALINNFRLISAGVRFWPTIEWVTNSDTLAVSKYYGCNMSPAALYDCFVEGNDVFNAVLSSPGGMEFSNNQGISSRMQPYQETLVNPMMMNSPYNLIQTQTTEQNGVVGDNLMCPVILARTTQTITLEPASFGTFPIRSYFRTMIEVQLQPPTPILATLTDIDLNWKTAVQIFQSDLEKYPVVVKGHSFKRITASISRIFSNTSGFVRDSNKLYNSVKRETADLRRQIANLDVYKTVVRGKPYSIEKGISDALKLPKVAVSTAALVPKVFGKKKRGGSNSGRGGRGGRGGRVWKLVN